MAGWSTTTCSSRPGRAAPRSPQPSSAARGSGDHGQAAVEFALALPLIVVMSLGLLVVGVAVRNELAVELAAREGARAASVSPDPAAATAAATDSVALPIEVSIREAAGRVSVTVTYTDPVDVAIIGPLIGPLTHTATVTMAVEPP